MRIVLEINILHLRAFPLMSLENLELQGGLYFKVINPETNKVYFTTMTNNLSKLYWNVQFPLYLYSNSKNLKFQLAGVIFGDYNQEERFEPWELLSFEFNLNELEENLFFATQKKTLINAKISEQFTNFLKKSKDARQMDYFKAFFFYIL